MDFIKRLHIIAYAYFVKWWRVRRTLQTFSSLHKQELAQSPAAYWPTILARQDAERRAIRAGKLDAPNVTDRKSWSWPFLPASINRLSVPLIKSTPYNLRRMSRTPVPHRAMQMIAGAMITQNWDVEPIEDYDKEVDPEDQARRQKIAKKIFNHPNNQDSFQTWLEQGLEDFHCFGGYVSELQLTPDPERPLKMWAVNVESIRVFASWQESTPDMPRYAQMTGLKGERGALLFYDDELIYIKDRPSTDNPFGLGCMEVAFQSLNAFLGVQDMAGRAGADQVHKTFMWFEQPQSESHLQIVRRYIQNELEGQAKLSIISGMKKPEIVDVTPVTEADLLLAWQELLIRMVANAFRMSAMALGVEHDVNRAVGTVLDDKDFRAAVVPTAKRLQEAFTRKILHQKLGWYDLQFRFTNLDDPDIETKIEMYQKLYGMNATTPNRVLRALGMKELESPLADLTQFESMLLNLEATAKIQILTQKSMMQLQQSMQPQLPPPDSGGPFSPDGGPEGAPEGAGQEEDGSVPFINKAPGEGGEGGGPGKEAGTTSTGQPKAPAKLSLPKFPISGTSYTAKQIARMPVNQVTDVWRASGQRPSMFLQSVDDQEPGILQELTDEVKVFFQEQLDREEQSKKKALRNIDKKAIAKWKKELAIKVRRQDKRTENLAEYLTDIGKVLHGRPDLAGRNPKAGRPGKLDRNTR